LFSDELNHASIIDGRGFFAGDDQSVSSTKTWKDCERILQENGRAFPGEETDYQRRRFLDGRRHRAGCRNYAIWRKSTTGIMMVDDGACFGRAWGRGGARDDRSFRVPTGACTFRWGR